MLGSEPPQSYQLPDPSLIEGGMRYRDLALDALSKAELDKVERCLTQAGQLFVQGGNYALLFACVREIFETKGEWRIFELMQKIADDEGTQVSNPCLSAIIYHLLATDVADRYPKKYSRSCAKNLADAIYFYAKSWCLRSVLACLELKRVPTKGLLRKPTGTDFLYGYIRDYQEVPGASKNIEKFEKLLFSIFSGLVHSSVEKKKWLIGSIPYFFWEEAMQDGFYPTFFELIARMFEFLNLAYISFLQALVAHWRQSSLQSPLLKNPYSKTGTYYSTAVSFLVDVFVRNYHKMKGGFPGGCMQFMQEIALDVPAEVWLTKETIDKREVTPLQRLESIPPLVLEPLLGTLREKIPSEEWPAFMQPKEVRPDAFFSLPGQSNWKAIYNHAKDWDINKVIACLLRGVEPGDPPEATDADVLYRIVRKLKRCAPVSVGDETVLSSEDLLGMILKGLAQMPGVEILSDFWEKQVDGLWCPLLLGFILPMPHKVPDDYYLNFFSQAILPGFGSNPLWGKPYIFLDEKREEQPWTAIGLLVRLLHESWNRMAPDYRKTWIQCIQDITAQNAAAIWDPLFDESFGLLSELYADEAKKPELESLVSAIKEKIPEAKSKFVVDTRRGLTLS